MSDYPKRCPKCNLSIYLIKGEEKWTCTHSPNYRPEHVLARRNKLIAVNDLTSGKYCDPFTLGHLFATGRIEFTVPEHASEAFRENYYSIKHKELPNRCAVYFNQKDKKEKRWFSSRVVFDDTEISINSEYETFDMENSNKIYISRNEFTWYLLNMGMAVDGNHDPEKALEVFTNEDDRNEFLRGFAGV